MGRGPFFVWAKLLGMYEPEDPWRMERQAMAKKIHTLAAPIAERLGMEVVLAEITGDRYGQVVRVTIDAPRGVTVEDCAMVSRDLSALMDVEDLFQGPYRIEVSSTGVERRLIRKDHFERFAGRRVRIELFSPLAGRRRFTGTILGVKGEEVQVECDRTIFSLPISGIKKANLRYP